MESGEQHFILLINNYLFMENMENMGNLDIWCLTAEGVFTSDH